MDPDHWKKVTLRAWNSIEGIENLKIIPERIINRIPEISWKNLARNLSNSSGVGYSFQTTYFKDETDGYKTKLYHLTIANFSQDKKTISKFEIRMSEGLLEFGDYLVSGIGNGIFENRKKFYRGQFKDFSPCGMGETVLPNGIKFVGEHAPYGSPSQGFFLFSS